MPFIRINTIDSLDFCYFPITKSRVSLSVKASHDARIALRTHLGDDSNAYEIVIGGWGNTMSAIKRNNMEPDVAEADTREILGGDEICDIWLHVGHEEDDSFMSYKDRDPFVINYIGVGTAWGATGEWIIEECRLTSPAVRQQLLETANYWIDYNDAEGLPRNAVMASEDGLYVGRAHHRESVTPGGVRSNVCTLPWGGAAHEKKDFQVLCGKDINWIKGWQGSVPLYALPAGETEDGNALFIGRILHDGIYYIGKVQPDHQGCYIPLNGQEISYLEYEVLVVNDCPILDCIGR
ncbi:uncharacterized protein LOC107275171 isoform X2 [Cephus cinctus]|uniref:Uncharacterized protein LOC107275171 isoform X2 n=1 Tax=Cephus cinctus TaxID=211228 RepID=A0AAJ7CGS9_CEPCN|nr:uncharacterized protein LOC107275171 isoform X2 [Cephus cinctus]